MRERRGRRLRRCRTRRSRTRRRRWRASASTWTLLLLLRADPRHRRPHHSGSSPHRPAPACAAGGAAAPSPRRLRLRRRRPRLRPPPRPPHPPRLSLSPFPPAQHARTHARTREQQRAAMAAKLGRPKIGKERERVARVGSSGSLSLPLGSSLRLFIRASAPGRASLTRGAQQLTPQRRRVERSGVRGEEKYLPLFRRKREKRIKISPMIEADRKHAVINYYPRISNSLTLI